MIESGQMNRVYIIAEAGINHNGSVTIAKKMIDVAVDAGADAVKFQTFRAEKVVSRYAPKAEYQKHTTGEEESQLEMAKKLELSHKHFKELAEYCKVKKIQFLSTPFDFESIDFLVGIDVDIFKIPSGEITNLPYLRKIGTLNKKLIMSTGMADLAEIEDAIKILTNSGTNRDHITILHCNTEYPTPHEDANLLAMIAIKEAFALNVGYSDHTLGTDVAVGAVALGAQVIEKHFTLDKTMEGPDHKSSLEPKELKQMVIAIRNMERALGDGIKRASLSEIKNRPIVRRSIVAIRNIKKNEVFTEENVTAKRPGTGISPMCWDSVIGTIAKRDFLEDELIEL